MKRITTLADRAGNTLRDGGDTLEIEIIAVAALITVGFYGVARLITKSGSKKAYGEALKVKDGIIDDLKGELRKWKGRATNATAPPYGAESVTDITAKLPTWARPLVKPLMEWANTDQGKATIDSLIKKYAHTPTGTPGQVEGGEGV